MMARAMAAAKARKAATPAKAAAAPAKMAPGKPMMAATKMGPKKPQAPRTAISLACSKQADAKGLHGKPREAFRASCMRGK